MRLAWCWDRLPLILGAAFAILSATIFVARANRTDWTECFMPAARQMMAGQPLDAAPARAYAYPPAMALVSVPLALLSNNWSTAAWYGVNMLAGFSAFVFTWRLAGGLPLVKLSADWQWTLVLGLVLASRWIIAPIEQQQFDIVIAALVMGGCYGVACRRSWTGGALLGAAAAMKCTPLLFLPYLIWKRRPTAAVALVLAALGLSLLPDLIYPRLDGQSYLGVWAGKYLAGLGNGVPGAWHSELLLNQSLGGLLNRFWRLFVSLSPDHGNVELPATAAAVLRWLTAGGALLLLATSFVRFGRPLALGSLPMSKDTRGPRIAWEIACIVSLMLLLSPMSSKGHYVILVLPCLLLARQCVAASTRSHMLLVALLLVCGPLTSKGLLGKSLGDWTLVCGLPTYFALLCWWTSWRALRVPSAGIFGRNRVPARASRRV